MESSRIKKVAVVGAGVSGVAAAAHLKRAGLDVTVFERYFTSGGVWVFDPRIPPEPPYPSMIPSLADFTAINCPHHGSGGEEGNETAAIFHAPPGPCYEGLINNVPTGLMEMKLNQWRPGTAPNVSHEIIAEYVQDTAGNNGIDSSIFYNSRVENAFKQADKWCLETSTLKKTALGKYEKIHNRWEFDALVVATGHYHACRIPDIPGLKEWKKNWPTRIQHSKSYRNTSGYKDKNVLLVGASTSSTDIAKQLSTVAKKIYQTSRGGLFDLPSAMLPENAVRIGNVVSFNHIEDPTLSSLESDQAIPGTITIADGSRLSHIDRILLCTGYHFSLPFLQEYHRDSCPPDAADDTVLVTDGEQVHNLHKDIFYIPDPSLSFIGIPFHVATFTLFEFQAIAIAAVYAGRAKLPTEEIMRAEYRERVDRKGNGKAFHSLKGKDVEYANELVSWVNADKPADGVDVVEGHTILWHEAFAAFKKQMQGRGFK